MDKPVDTEPRGQAARDTNTTLVVIADLHGHLALFDLMLARIDQDHPDARIVTLGDYVDNGPEVPALLDRLIALKAQRPARFFPILGNHDLALLRALGWPGRRPDPTWYRQWQGHYWNHGLGTPRAYGADDLESFVRSFPPAHFEFLASLPWFYDDGEHFCVHAGLRSGPIAPQRVALAAKELPAQRLFLPDAIRDKGLAKFDNPLWERVVVSGHTHLPGQAVFSGQRRLLVSATADHGGGLLGVALPQRRCWRAVQGAVMEVGLG